MSQKPNPPRHLETEARAYAANLRISPRKLNLVAQLIRGKACQKALADLSFTKRRIAQDVKKLLESAIANAENNHQLDVDKLFVAEASVGRGLVMKRFHARARGRGSRILKPFSNMTLIVREKLEPVKADTNADEKEAA
jgi:large subunit ribosomal protein L22